MTMTLDLPQIKVAYPSTCVRLLAPRYTGTDAANKPAEIYSGSEKLHGQAIENWCLLRLLPVIVDIGVYCITNAIQDPSVVCVHQEELLDYYPLHEFKLCGLLSEETLKKLVDGLVAVGVETQANLQFVKEEDLLEHLKPIQCRKLLNAWKCEGGSDCSRCPKNSIITRFPQADYPSIRKEQHPHWNSFKGIVDINPGTGSKVGAGKQEKKRSGMNPHVCTLLRKLMDFEWLSL
ncbi:hypothetical protein AOLI_G00286450 [Acnodon oligacanthus]